MRWAGLLWLVVAGHFIADAQEIPRTEVDLAKIADELLSTQDEDLNYEALYENLMQALSNPIDLNKASVEDLRFINILSQLQLTQLMSYIKDNGRLLSIYELQAVPGFDVQTITRLAPFVKVIDATNAVDASLVKRIQKESDSFFSVRMERPLSTRDGQSTFKGSPEKMYVRFGTSRAGDFSFGFTGEKDAGEPYLFDGKNGYYGLDYWSFHAQVQNKGKLKNLILGDYQVQFGQGLMIGGIFGMGKGSETITAIRRSNIGVLPYTSAYEPGNLRGIASTIQMRRFMITTFYSRALRDGALSSDTTDYTTTNLQATGLHRTTRELAQRKSVVENNVGVVCAYSRNTFEAGLMFNHFAFDASISPNETPYNQFAFQGDRNSNVGLFLNYNAKGSSFFSEVAHSLQGGTAYIVGGLFSLSPNFDLSLLYRNFDANFYTRFSNAFGENTSPQNETGIYWGWRYKVSRKVTLAGYADLFRFPWLRYRGYAPSDGYEYLIRFTFQPSRNATFFLQAREEGKDRNSEGAIPTVYATDPTTRRGYWIHFETGLRDKLRFKTRVQISTFSINGNTTNGIVVAQDIRFAIGKFQLTGRYALFDTEDYDNRQYMYENDVLFAYSMPAYFGLGVRKMLMIQYKLNRHLSVWLRFASTRYHDQEKINTSSENTLESLKNDVKFQFRIQF